MATTSNPGTARRQYRRRTDEERIAELEARIAELKERKKAKEKLTDPVLREIPKVQKRLRKFAQLAADNDRLDVANSTNAFVAGLERTLRADLKQTAPARAKIEDAEE